MFKRILKNENLVENEIHENKFISEVEKKVFKLDWSSSGELLKRFSKRRMNESTEDNSHELVEQLILTQKLFSESRNF